MRSRGRLRLLIAAVTLFSTCGAFAVASAASAAGRTVSCGSFTGTDSSTQYGVGGCTGNTGTSGTVSDLTITWENGHTTILAARAFTPDRRHGRGRCAADAGRFEIKDHVVADSSGSIRTGGRLSATLCILDHDPGTWTLEPGTSLTLS